MSRFLSEQWGDQVRDALNSDPNVKADIAHIDVTIQQVVTDVPDEGEVRYFTRIKDGEISGGRGDAPDADVTITQDYETAAALNRGELNPQAAFMQGKLKVGGNMGKLLQHQPSLQSMGPVLAAVETEY